jgi:transcription termination factor Rho
MSSDQADLGFEEQQPPADKPAAKKAARKTAARKTARKAATKKVPRRKAAEPAAGESAAQEPAPAKQGKPAPVKESKPVAPKGRKESDVPEVYSSDFDTPPPKPVEVRAEPARRPDRERNSDDGERRSGNQNQDNPRDRDSDGRGNPRRNDPRGNKGYRQKPYNPNGQKKAQGPGPGGPGGGGNQPKQKRRDKRRPRDMERRPRKSQEGQAIRAEWGELGSLEVLRTPDKLEAYAAEITDSSKAPLYLDEIWAKPFLELREWAQKEYDLGDRAFAVRQSLVEAILDAAYARKQPLHCRGIVELLDDGTALVVYQSDNYQIRPASAFLPKALVRKYAIKKGTILEGQFHPRRKALPDDAIDKLKQAGRDDDEIDAIPDDVEEDLAAEALAALFPENDYMQDSDAEDETCPYVVKILSLMGRAPEENLEVTPFEDLIPYYPTERIILETEPKVKWDNTAMRVVDLLTPVGLGQRGLIVAPPRTGKTILQQAIANAVAVNKPEAHLIILLIDERPEEVTDFRRQITTGEVIASTFDETPENHVHCAEMVIEKARRMVENGQHVIILLDSITRLARAYNALASNSGKILSGGVEANALQKPKRFFGSARNIEGAGSLTILGTALVETGSRMDEVIFEEFKGTGNMELHLDRALSDNRIFPAIEMAKSGTRKEELLYHPEEMHKVYGLRRAMKGVPPTDAMEMLITRIKKTTTNIQFLMGVNT